VRAGLPPARVAELSRLSPIDEPAVEDLLARVEAANGGPMKDDVALVAVSRRA